jgi:pyrimidine-nucleoside phosphorylase
LAVGIVLRKKVGDPVRESESLATIHANRENIEEVIQMMRENIQISAEASPPKLIHGELF